LANRLDRRLVELRRRFRELGGKANARRIVSDELGRNINRLKQQIDGLRQKIEEFIEIGAAAPKTAVPELRRRNGGVFLSFMYI